MPATPLPELTDVTPSIPRFAVVAPATKLPVASRLTMVLAVSAFVGATVQFRPRVPAPVTGEPVTLNSDEGALNGAIPVRVLLSARIKLLSADLKPPADGPVELI